MTAIAYPLPRSSFLPSPWARAREWLRDKLLGNLEDFWLRERSGILWAVSTPTGCGTANPAVDGGVITMTVNTTATVPSGGKILISVGWFSATANDIQSVTADLCTGGILVAMNSNGSEHQGAAYLDAPFGLPSGSPVVINWPSGTAANSRHVHMVYVTGAASGAALARQSGTGSGQAWSTGAMTAANGNMIYHQCYIATDTTETATSPNTKITSTNTSGDSTMASQYVISSGSSITPAGGWGGTSSWASLASEIGAGTIDIPPYAVVASVAESANPTTAATSHTVTYPSGIQAGDTLICIADKGSTAATVNALAGWTELLDENLANGLYIAWHLCDGTETGTFTLTTSASTRLVEIVYRIVNAADPTVSPPEIATTGTGTSTTPDPPSITPSGGTKDYLYIAFAGMAGEEADDDTWGNSSPTNYLPAVPRQKTCGTVGTNLGGLILSAERGVASSTTENPGTFSVDVSAAWRSQTIAVYPAVTSTPIAGSDSGSGSESAVVTYIAPGADAGAGADTATMQWSPTSSDVNGTVTESGAVTAPKAGSDANGTVTENATMTFLVGVTDTGAGSDNAARNAQLSGADTGAGSDAATMTVAWFVTDVNGTVTENGVVTIAGLQIAGSDAGSGSDLAALLAAISGADTGTDSESGTVAVVIAGADVGSGLDNATLTFLVGAADTNGPTVENAVLVFAISGADTGAGSDNAVKTVSASGTDSGTGADAGSRQGFYAVSDAGTGSATGLLIARLTGADSALGADSGGVLGGQVFLTGFDTGLGVDIVTAITAVLVGSDAAAGTDLVRQMAKTGEDAGSGSEASQINKAWFVTDSGTGEDNALLTAILAALDEATSTESGSLSAATMRFGMEFATGVDNAAAWEKIERYVRQVVSAVPEAAKLLSAKEEQESDLESAKPMERPRLTGGR